MRKGILALLAFGRKQHLVKVTLYENMLIGWDITSQDSDWDLGFLEVEC